MSTANSVAATIVEQLGGVNRLRAMIGADTFVAGVNLASFWFKGSRKYKLCVVKLEPTDTYCIEFWGRRDGYVVKLKEITGVYVEQLVEVFEQTTGLYLTLARRG